MHADAGYLGVEKREEIVALKREVKWQIAAKRGAIQHLAEGEEKEMLRGVERAKAQVRAKVEHPFAGTLRCRPSGCLLAGYLAPLGSCG